MKRLSSLALILSIFLIPQIQAQDIKFGLETGYGISKTNSQVIKFSTDPIQSLQIYGIAEWYFFDNRAISSGIGLSQSGVILNNKLSHNRYSEVYIDIPVGLKLYFSGFDNGLYINPGIVGSYLLNSELTVTEKITGDNEKSTIDTTDDLNTYNASILLDIGYDYPTRAGVFGVKIRGLFGFTETYKSFSGIATNRFSVMATYRY